jgi:hypothetical protein
MFGHSGDVMIHKTAATLLTIPLLAAAFPSQPSKSQALLMALRANSQKMADYQWKQRITVFRKGIPSGVILEELRFDLSGQVLRTVLSKPEERRMGPLRARKAAEVKEDIQEVMQLAGRYGDPQAAAQAIQKGEIWEGPDALRVQARSVILPGDEMTMVVNPATFVVSHADVRTQHEGGPVTISIDYRPLPGGPGMMTQMSVQIPAGNIAVNVEAYDFVRLAAR